MRRVTRREDGATALFVAIVLGCLLAAAGIGIDTTSMAFQRSRVQHGTDAGALAVAQSCKAGACDASLAGQFLSKNASGGGADTGPGVSITSTTVTVGSSKAVETSFFGLLGVGSKSVSASSTASWNTSPTSGDVLPFLVSLCEYTKVNVNDATFIDTNSNDDIKDYKQNDQQKRLSDDGNLTSGCGTIPTGVSVPGLSGSTRMVIGGLWKSSNGKCDASANNGKSHLSIGDAVGDFQLCGANTQQTDKYGGTSGTDKFVPGKVTLFALYAPTKNFAFGGVKTKNDGTTPTTEFADNAPSFNFKVVGFAPFKVTGFRLGTAGNSCLGSCPNGKIGIWGSFVNDISEDADYEVGGPNIGSVVKLID
jgi:Flp pilus assembly protein TadG